MERERESAPVGRAPNASASSLLALQRSAGNSAVGRLLAGSPGLVQRRIGWSGVKKGSVNDEARDTDQTQVLRIPVEGIDEGVGKGRAIVVVPHGKQHGGSIEVLFHLHGHHLLGFGAGYAEHGGQADDEALYRIEQQLGALEQAGRWLVGILPQGPTGGTLDKKHYHENVSIFGKKGAAVDVNSYVKQALDLAQEKWPYKPAPGGGDVKNVVLSGHSGAGEPFRQMFESQKNPTKDHPSLVPDRGHFGEFLSFDTINGSGEYNAQRDFLLRQLELDLKGIEEVAAQAKGAPPDQVRKLQLDWLRAHGFRYRGVHTSQGYAHWYDNPRSNGDKDGMKQRLERWLAERGAGLSDAVRAQIFGGPASNYTIIAAGTDHMHMMGGVEGKHGRSHENLFDALAPGGGAGSPPTPATVPSAPSKPPGAAVPLSDQKAGPAESPKPARRPKPAADAAAGTGSGSAGAGKAKAKAGKTPGPSSDVDGTVALADGTYEVASGKLLADRGGARTPVGTVQAQFSGSGKAAKPSAFPAKYTDVSGKEQSVDLLAAGGERSTLHVGARWLVKVDGAWSSPGKLTKKRGFEKSGGGRLDEKLRDMQRRGAIKVGGNAITLSDDDIFVLQGMANVETGGNVAGINTWDNMIISMGFKQVTLGYGSLQQLIGLAPEAFRRHGIELGSGNYSFKFGSDSSVVPKIKGVDDAQELRGAYWAEKFYEAGLDEDVISAEVKFALDELGVFEKKLKQKTGAAWIADLDDPTVKAWLFEMYNNRKSWTFPAVEKALARLSKLGHKPSREEVLDAVQGEIEGVYAEKEVGKEKDPVKKAAKEAEGRRKARNITSKIPRQKGAAAAPAKGPADGAASLLDLPRAIDSLGADAGSLVSHVLEAYRRASAGGAAQPDAVLAALPPAVRRQVLALATGDPIQIVAALLSWGGGTAGKKAVAGKPPPKKKQPTADVDTPKPEPQQGSAAVPAVVEGAGGGDFIKDVGRKTLELLPEKQRTRFEHVPWVELDYPGSKMAVENTSEANLAKWRADPNYVLFQNAKGTWFIKGAHQAEAQALLDALAKVRPGGGERRANTGDTAVLTQKQFLKNARRYDEFIASQLTDGLPGQKSALQLNKHAAEAFAKLYAAAKQDGVKISIDNSFRDRKTAEANAAKKDNPKAVAKFSAHTLGLAMDLNLWVKGMGSPLDEKGAKMVNIGRMFAAPAYKWMFMHGADYGFYQFRMEPWHWEYNPAGFKESFFADAPDLQPGAEETATPKKSPKAKAGAH